MAEALDVNTLKRRSRRRLVGAVALVLLAVIVLPMVFDTEPRQAVPSVSVRIPSEGDATFAPKLAPPAPSPAVTPAAPSSRAATPAPTHEKSTVKQESAPTTEKQKPAAARPKASAPAKRAEAKPSARDEREERARAESALANAEFIVPVAALADPDRVKRLTARLAAAKLPYYTEPIATSQGTVTRVRAGPFADRAAAERALKKLRSMGLKPGKVFVRS